MAEFTLIELDGCLDLAQIVCGFGEEDLAGHARILRGVTGVTWV
jgi:hypothetical protein